MQIKEGYNDKETEIRLSVKENGSIELWIKQKGLNDELETLSYMSADELHQLFLEVKQAGRDLFC